MFICSWQNIRRSSFVIAATHPISWNAYRLPLQWLDFSCFLSIYSDLLDSSCVCVCVYLSFTVFFSVLSFEVESIPWVRKKRRRNARATQRFIKSKSRVCAVNVYSGTIGALVTLWHCFPSTIPSSLKSIESLVYFTVASCHVFFQFIFISFVYSLPLSLSLLQHIHFFHLLFARSFTQFV